MLSVSPLLRHRRARCRTAVFPQCYHNKSEANPTRCFNTQLVRLQDAWETLASTRPYVTAINLLGATQVAGGDPKAAIGKPNLDSMGPRKYWPDTLGCIHPSTSGGEKSGVAIAGLEPAPPR